MTVSGTERGSFDFKSINAIILTMAALSIRPGGIGRLCLEKVMKLRGCF